MSAKCIHRSPLVLDTCRAIYKTTALTSKTDRHHGQEMCTELIDT